MLNIIKIKFKNILFFVILSSTLFIMIPPQPAHADFFSDITNIYKVVGKINSTVNTITGIARDAVKKIKEVAEKVAEIADLIGDELFNFLYDTVRLIIGINPAKLAESVVYNELYCEELPAFLLDPEAYIGTELSAIEEFIPFLTLLETELGFSITNIAAPSQVRGIIPTSATTLELYEFKLYTAKPMAALLGMASGPFKIPAAIGSTLADFCVEATVYYQGEKDSNDALIADIHHILSSNDEIKNAQYQLPNSTDGYLEEIERELRSTISKYEGLNLGVKRDVYIELQKGQYYYAIGEFRKSYQAFQKSYKKLTKN